MCYLLEFVIMRLDTLITLNESDENRKTHSQLTHTHHPLSRSADVDTIRFMFQFRRLPTSQRRRLHLSTPIHPSSAPQFKYNSIFIHTHTAHGLRWLFVKAKGKWSTGKSPGRTKFIVPLRPASSGRHHIIHIPSTLGAEWCSISCCNW